MSMNMNVVIGKDDDKVFSNEQLEKFKLKLRKVYIIEEDGGEQKEAYLLGMVLPDGTIMEEWHVTIDEMIKFREMGMQLYSANKNKKCNSINFSAQMVTFSEEVAKNVWEQIIVPELLLALMSNKFYS